MVESRVESRRLQRRFSTNLFRIRCRKIIFGVSAYNRAGARRLLLRDCVLPALASYFAARRNIDLWTG
jgi:hypothetical protein